MTMYSPVQKDKEPQTVVIESINLMLGREIIDIESAKAGTVVAIRIGDWIQHSTLLSEPLQTAGLNFDNTGLEPLVRVTGEPIKNYYF
jgi:translation elongation factor EF-G